MAISQEQARALKRGDVLHQTGLFGRECTSRNGPVRWRVNGMVKTWKRAAERFYVPLKHGLRSFGWIDETTQERDLADLHLEAECPAVTVTA